MKRVKMHLFEFDVEDDSISIKQEIHDSVRNLTNVSARTFETNRDTLSGLHSDPQRNWLFLHIGKFKPGALESCIDLNQSGLQTLDPQQISAPQGTEFLNRQSFCLLWKNKAIVIVSDSAGFGDVWEFLRELLKRKNKNVSINPHRVISHELKTAIEKGDIKGVTIRGLTTESCMKRLFEKGNTLDEMYITGSPKSEYIKIPLAMTFKYCRGQAEDFLNLVMSSIKMGTENPDDVELDMDGLTVVIDTKKNGLIRQEGFAMARYVDMTEYGSFVLRKNAHGEMLGWMKEIINGGD